MFFRHKNQDDLWKRLEGRLSALSQEIAVSNEKLDILGGRVSNLEDISRNPASLHDISQNIGALNQNMGNLGQHVDSLNQHVGSLNQHVDSLSGNVSSLNQNMGSLGQDVSQLHGDVRKHDMAIEDLLDEWEEKKSDEEGVRARMEEYGQTEKLLLELFEAYQEQFWNLKHYAADKDAAWAAQIALMEKNLEHYRRLCAISLIQECGVDVDYGLHEIIEAIDTADPAQDKKIADIYRCGYLYKGKVRKKAQAAAYRFSDTQVTQAE